METRGRTKKRRARVTKQVRLLKSGARSESKDYLYTPADLTGKLGINQYMVISGPIPIICNQQAR